MTEESFKYLYETYLKFIIKFIMAHYEPDLECAKDIAQEVFETLWEKRERINDENEIRMVK